MKKVIKSVSAFVICLCSLISVFGCSCAKAIDVKYTVNIENAVETSKVHKLSGLTIINRKYREPFDTPCYSKNGDKYELIEDAQEVYECYDSVGNKFEKATHNRPEKLELNREVNVTYQSSDRINSYSSSKIEVPTNSSHSLIYDFKFTNNDSEAIYIKVFDVKTIVDNQLNEEGLLKVSAKFTYGQIVTIDQENYYKLNANDKLLITVQIQGLLKKHAKKGVKELNLNIPLVVRYN